MLNTNLLNKETGFLFYGLTPPKITTSKDKIEEIANKQIERLQHLDLDALVLYDIQDESSRTNLPRPFPYLSTLAPDEYSSVYLNKLNIPKIIYKSVGKFTKAELAEWLQQNVASISHVVFVGSPSKNQAISISLQDAYKIKQELNTPIHLGGITIPERHDKKGDEHLRVFEKKNNGCSFFISQCVYSTNNTKNFLSDYFYFAKENNLNLSPVIFTLTPCGSIKTLQFMDWLGIHIPKWLKNDLKHSENILSKSVEICENIATELIEYCSAKKIPFGFNIESVAIKKEEIEASVELVNNIKKMLTKI